MIRVIDTAELVDMTAELEAALRDVQAVLQLGVLACNGDPSRTICALLGAAVAVAAASAQPDALELLDTAAQSIEVARRAVVRKASAPAAAVDEAMTS